MNVVLIQATNHRGHGNVQADARIIPTNAEELQQLDAEELTSRVDDARNVAFDQASEALRRLRDASQKAYSGECNQRGEDTDDCAYADSQDIDEYSEEDEGSEEETVEMERLERNEREEQLKALKPISPAFLAWHWY